MLIGHKKQWDFLERKFKDNQLSHAYLFSGPGGVGKKKFSLELVKSISCKKEDHYCQLIEKGSHPDVLMVSPKDEGEIQIAQIREVQQFLSLKPYYSLQKTVIIDQAHKMNQEAQSCFLKTLEEPKGKTLLILLSAYPEMMLPTILSRCQIVKFPGVKKEEIKKYLLENNIPEDKAEMLSILSDGKPGRVISLLADDKMVEKEREDMEKIAEICQADIATKFQYTKSLAEGSFTKTLVDLRKYLRYILLFRVGIKDTLDYFPKINNKFETMPILQLKKIIGLTEKIDFYLLTTNVNQKLALETLLLEI